MKSFKAPFTGEIWNRVCYLVSQDKWYSLPEIAKIWKDSPYIAERCLDMAINSKVIIKKGIGRMKKYKLNRKDSKVKDMIKQFEKLNVKLPRVKSMGGRQGSG